MNKYVKNYILSVANTVMGLLFPIITFPYVSRVLGPDNLGIINFAQSYGYYFVHFASFGINSYAIREVSKVRDDKEKVSRISNEIFNLNILFSLLSVVIYFVGVLLVPKLRENFIIFALYSIVISTNFLGLEWLLQSFDDYLFTTVRSLLIRVLTVVAVFVFIHTDEDYVIYMLISSVAEMGTRLSNLLYCRREYVKLVLNIKYLNFKAHIKQLFTLFSFRLVNGISAHLDQIMIGFMLAYVNVGLYTAGVKFPLMVIPIVETVGIVLFPKINLSANADKNEYNKMLKLNYDIILLLSIPMAVGLFLVSPRLLILFAGEEYTAAVMVSRIMTFVIFLCPIGDLLGSKTLLIHNKDKELLVCSTIVAISNVVLNFIMIPIWGIEGAALASALSYAVAVTSRLFYTKKIMDFKFFTKDMVRYFIYTIPFIVIYIIFQKQIDTSNIWMFAFVAVCIIIYLGELALTKDYLFDMMLKKVLKKEGGK